MLLWPGGDTTSKDLVIVWEEERKVMVIVPFLTVFRAVSNTKSIIYASVAALFDTTNARFDGENATCTSLALAYTRAPAFLAYTWHLVCRALVIIAETDGVDMVSQYSSLVVSGEPSTMR